MSTRLQVVTGATYDIALQPPQVQSALIGADPFVSLPLQIGDKQVIIAPRHVVAIEDAAGGRASF